ncbi:hypothetical protein CEXT_433961 [Caerostris extrusa]|uniref:Uncharacterized protein n=1 Tax=Caerostris extrusa TaxID=172846 RepID=A0AAV4XRL0_CAEEX|nr:hypothetical protein CEXT_433961 [Caerostris extrusa]
MLHPRKIIGNYCDSDYRKSNYSLFVCGPLPPFTLSLFHFLYPLLKCYCVSTRSMVITGSEVSVTMDTVSMTKYAMVMAISVCCDALVMV